MNITVLFKLVYYNRIPQHENNLTRQLNNSTRMGNDTGLAQARRLIEMYVNKLSEVLQDEARTYFYEQETASWRQRLEMQRKRK